MDISFWWDTLPAALKVPVGQPLRGDTDADVAIVGGGYTGLWTAYYLKQASPDLRIAVIEAHVAGFGASGRNGGWASALFPASLESLAKSHNRESAIRMKRTMFETVREIGSVARDHGWDIDWEYGGSIGVARSPLQWVRAQAEIAHLRSWGFGEEDYALLNAKESSEHIQVQDAIGAVFTPHCAAINPAKLVRHLVNHVHSMGVEICEQTRALEITSGHVRTDQGVVRAPIIVRATEGYTAQLPGLKRAIAPVYSLMLATEALPPDLWDEIGLQGRETFYDGRNLIIYGQRTADGRLAFGGRGAPYHFGSRVKAEFDRDPKVHQALRNVLVDFFPAIADVPITHTWGGPLGIARDWWASAGFDPKSGLAWAGGYVGDGVGTSNLAGRTLRDLILQRNTDLTTLPWVNHHSRPWEPEPLRWLGTNVGMQVMTYADAKERRTGRSSWSGEVFSRAIGH